MRTFNCGIGFCIIVKKKILKSKKNFSQKEFMPYEIGFISQKKKTIHLSKSIKW